MGKIKYYALIFVVIIILFKLVHSFNLFYEYYDGGFFNIVFAIIIELAYYLILLCKRIGVFEFQEFNNREFNICTVHLFSMILMIVFSIATQIVHTLDYASILEIKFITEFTINFLLTFFAGHLIFLITPKLYFIQPDQKS